MRITYILAVTVAATLHSSVTAIPSVKSSKVATENGAVPAVIDSTHTGTGRMLRWVNKYEGDLDDNDDLDDLDDDLEEERGFSDTLKKANPLKLVKKGTKLTAEQAAKVKQALKDGADYQKMIDNANKLIRSD
ncbi:hypothetical protein DVH05_001203 [Phytophthora capsici]|nr:hypothetical protein DVH05_001203 [Phytophthora capsici]